MVFADWRELFTVVLQAPVNLAELQCLVLFHGLKVRGNASINRGKRWISRGTYGDLNYGQRGLMRFARVPNVIVTCQWDVTVPGAWLCVRLPWGTAVRLQTLGCPDDRGWDSSAWQGRYIWSGPIFVWFACGGLARPIVGAGGSACWWGGRNTQTALVICKTVVWKVRV